MNTLEIIKQKANFLNNLSENEDALFDYINNNHENLDEVIIQYKPEREFRPVNTLRFLIANELKKGNTVNKIVVEELKQAIENRNVSAYFNLTESVQQSLENYKDSKSGMFPNWRHAFKILFPFIHNTQENEEVKTRLNQLADEIITVNQLENVTKHIVSFQGSQNYGSDRVWVAIIPKTTPSVQYAYQIFFNINKSGLVGGIHKGHNLVKQTFNNQDDPFETWETYLSRTKEVKEQWAQLNSEINFIILSDQKDFIKVIKKIEVSSLTNYFKTLDRLKEDLDIQDEEKLVFSLAKNRLSFHVGKRYCLNIGKDKLFDFISNADTEEDNINRETFSGEGSTYLYKKRTYGDVFNNYQEIKSAVENEIGRDNHALAKFYDNSSFRKALFDNEYRKKILKESGMQNKYYLVGAYWSDEEPKNQTERFVKDGIWVNGYEDKFLNNVNEVAVGSIIAIKSAFTREKTKSVMAIKARGIVTHNLKDGRNLKVDWEQGFEPFEVSFGGYLTTIKEVKKANHINAIWSKTENMKNVKQEFINWYIANPRSSYFNNEPDRINDYLTKSSNNFSKDIFMVSSTIYMEIIDFIEETINNNKDKFLKNHGAPDSGKLAAIVGKRNYQKFLKEYFNKKEGGVIKNDTEYKAPLNQIFYGPPGTGKTYKTILESAKIITQNELLNYSLAQSVFNENLKDKIEFITFHQNYSYEDFIQGLRPDIEEKALSFNRADGVFAKMVTNALFEYYKVYQNKQKQVTDTVDVKIDLNDAFIEFFNSLEKGQEFETKTGAKIKVDNFTDRQNIEFRPVNGVKSYLVSSNRLLKLYKEYDDINKIERVHEDIREAIGGCNSSIYYVALREFINFLEKYKESVDEFVDEVEEYDDISYRRKKELLSNFTLEELRSISVNEVPNYVIIIDEINRANISRVFGELITLIEKDKRSHGNIPLSATLPSGEKFIVPSNLYIIGTMNTADKSIALLDIALRRRFEFKAMYPKYTIEGKTIHKAEFLKKLNELIVKSGKGHDFTIGHSYFMCDDNETFDFENTINNKVIPLMLEYYMNAEEEVKKILKEAGVTVGNWPLEVLPND